MATLCCAPGVRSESAFDENAPTVSGMVVVRNGVLERGRDASERPDEVPRHRITVGRFAIDATLVTRKDFALFVAETAYVTFAERVGFGMGAWEGLEDWEWQRMPGASWRHPFPEGLRGGEAFMRDDAPVVLVNWFDAERYCAHRRKRLPTEAEWEYAMRAGAWGMRYPWGQEAVSNDGRFGLNFWQGETHEKNTRLDGFTYVSPVKAFPPNAWNIYDPVGNVWQWTADWYARDTYERSARTGRSERPANGQQRVLRGGSWWCGACTCEGNGLYYRGKADPMAAYNNNGFRCASDIP